MFDPPPGWTDCETDCAAAPPGAGPFRELTVEGIGVVHARYPMPNALSALASAENSKIEARARMDHRDRFVMNHLQPGEFDELLERMMADEVPLDTMLRVSRAIATAGTSRPT